MVVVEEAVAGEKERNLFLEEQSALKRKTVPFELREGIKGIAD